MGKTKVIHVITRFDKGGSSENTFLTVKGLNRNKYDVILIRGLAEESRMGREEAAAAARNMEQVENAGIRVITIPELVRSIAVVNDIKALFALLRIFKYEKPQLVHTHTSKAGILGRWAAFFAKTGTIIHTPHGHVFWGYFGRLKTCLFILLEKLTSSITDKIITLTEQEKQDHLHFRIAPKDKFTVIHSGVDLTAFAGLPIDTSAAVREELKIPPEALVVGTTGRLTPVKGHRYLLEAAAVISHKKPGIFFVFLGDGELADEIAEKASLLGIKNATFLGWRPDVPEVMSTFDIFVLPSLNEGMGKVLVEAMALGIPIIASNVGGIPDLVKHGVNGLLVPPADAVKLAGGIEELVHDPVKRKKLGERGRLIAVAYSAEAMVQKIELLYEETSSSARTCAHGK